MIPVKYETDANTGAVAVRVAGRRVANDPSAILAATRAAMVVSPRQARLAMMQTTYSEYPSLHTAVEAVVYGSNDPAVLVAWEYAAEWRRDDALLNQLASGLGLTDTDLDALFVRAMAL